MCRGYTYDLVCGHQLIHFSFRCVEQCAIPQGFRKSLHDTCAACTPSFQNSHISRKYDELRKERMIAVRAAQAAHDRQAEDEVTAQIAEDSRSCAAEIQGVTCLRRKLGGADGREVVFPSVEISMTTPGNKGKAEGSRLYVPQSDW